MPNALPYKLNSEACLPRHHHLLPYATVVLEGGYQEAGDAGRLDACAGEVLFHRPFSVHSDRISARKTVVLDLPLSISPINLPPQALISDLDFIVRVARNDTRAAFEHLLEDMKPMSKSANDMPDLLARSLSSSTPPRIAEWSHELGLSREYVARQFRKAYGVAPARYRTEAVARRAWHLIIASADSLSAIACQVGYSDQAHMTRSILALTGKTPGEWRRCFPLPEMPEQGNAT